MGTADQSERIWSRTNLAFLCAFVCILAYRIALCAQVPADTSDALRNLGFSSHLSTEGFAVYDHKASDFAPELWTYSWPNQGYIYPPLVMVFFACFSKFGLGIFFVKLMLTLIELATSLVIARHLDRLAGLAYWAMPMSLWYVSHEGQFEPLQNILLLFTILMVKRQRWVLAGMFWALAVQVKHFPVLLLPWIIYLLTKEDPKVWGRCLLGGVLGVIPFAGFYWSHPSIPFLPLQNMSLNYNPYAWDLLDARRFLWNPSWLVWWNGLFSLTILSGALVVLRKSTAPKETLASASPVILFWTLLKSLNWTQFWYALTSPIFMLCISGNRKWVLALFIFSTLQDPRSALLLAGHQFGWKENAQSVSAMEQNMFRLQLKHP